MKRRPALVLGVLATLAAAATLPAATGRAIEWNRLSPEGLRLVEPVLDTAQIARDVGHITYPSRAEVWEYLLDNPDFAADVARVLREGKYRIRRVGDHYDAADGRGVTGTMRPLYADPGRRIFYLEGRYDTRWLPTLRGRAVLVLDTDHTQPATGLPQADVRVQGHLRIDNALVGAFIAIARDFSERTFEAKVRRFFSHVERVSRKACEDPRGLADLLAAQPELDREHVAEFRRVLLNPRRPLRRAA